MFRYRGRIINGDGKIYEVINVGLGRLRNVIELIKLRTKGKNFREVARRSLRKARVKLKHHRV